MRGWRGPHRSEIVVGVDGSAACRRAVEFAAREAVLRDANLVAVMSIGEAARAGSTRGVSTGRMEAAEHRLRQFLESVGTGGVDVTLVVTTLGPAEALVDRSRFAELLVLGARAGSVSAAGSVRVRCLDEAQCPVVAVRPDRQRRPATDPAGHDAIPRLVGQMQTRPHRRPFDSGRVGLPAGRSARR
jgi:nucleotide-binding universal stress UspA family protein